MAQLLGQLLQAEEPLFSHGMAQLERSACSSGVDVRLIADIIESAHKVMRSLGLDPANTTAEELYGSLKNYVRTNGITSSLLEETDYVLLMLDGRIISFNLIDVVENSHHELGLENGIFSHGQRSLMGEIIKRYVEHARTNEATTLEIARSIGITSKSDML